MNGKYVCACVFERGVGSIRERKREREREGEREMPGVGRLLFRLHFIADDGHQRTRDAQMNLRETSWNSFLSLTSICCGPHFKRMSISSLLQTSIHKHLVFGGELIKLSKRVLLMCLSTAKRAHCTAKISGQILYISWWTDTILWWVEMHYLVINSTSVCRFFIDCCRLRNKNRIFYE